jgi:hypothetical protein
MHKTKYSFLFQNTCLTTLFQDPRKETGGVDGKRSLLHCGNVVNLYDWGFFQYDLVILPRERIIVIIYSQSQKCISSSKLFAASLFFFSFPKVQSYSTPFLVHRISLQLTSQHPLTTSSSFSFSHYLLHSFIPSVTARNHTLDMLYRYHPNATCFLYQR